MRQVAHQGNIRLLADYFIALIGVLIAILLALLGVDNTFWYKSATLLYALSSVMYISYSIFRNSVFAKVSTFTLFLGLILNLTGMIRRSIQSYELGVFHPPWSNLFEALTFWSFIVGSIYLIIERKYGLRLLGAFVVPIAFVLSAFAVLKASKDITPLMPALRSYWLYLHVVTAFIGYAGFTVAFAGAVLYLLKGRFPQTRLLPSQDLLEEITYKSIILVFPVWTASIILGSAWANEAWGGYWSWDPKEVWALIVWLFFGAYLHARQMLGWKGKRTAWMVVFGFITVLICFFAINLYFPGLHSYATD
ncbi:c-type cytochrome biogenesis protein CcsB [Hydrogenobacter hydrogenophilus]|uniref:Cytochrome c-type biogenesis protein CcsB n=1 Tax=Hydrogenobacter hydrogenophilus TaxID=35835 RepID=A0A285P5D2_9AQUI|nr:c-type cytochrome biogenesis protein CcsB [Hydrogenobacter hydrogenophilus]SNZ16924.1 cytochrome c-type biogenesis protein CcsB [Hydrogenobacter hydrogenophilus]